MATITGTSKNDILVGGSGRDTIYGRGGNDRILGGGGNDALFGEGGDDRLDGRDGDDRLYGDAGNDVMLGGLGDNVAFGGSGDDVYNDVYDVRDAYGTFTQASRNTVHGGDGRDVLYGGNLHDRLYGDADDDTLFGLGSADRLEGGSGNDLLSGGNGNDVLLGGAGNDELTGGNDVDKLYGGAGDDLFSFFFHGDLDAVSKTYDEAYDTIVDFVRGDDRIVTPSYFANDIQDRVPFSELDSNRNGVLDDGDAAVVVGARSVDGASRVSTVIDMGLTSIAVDGVEGTITIFGVTGMTAADFVG